MFYFILLIHKLHTEILWQHLLISVVLINCTCYKTLAKVIFIITYQLSLHRELLHAGLQKELVCSLRFISRITASPEPVRKTFRYMDILTKIYLRMISQEKLVLVILNSIMRSTLPVLLYLF